jgi:hypothetical protein
MREEICSQSSARLRIGTVVAFMIMLFIGTGPFAAYGKEADQKTFATPHEAIRALTAAVKTNDQSALIGIFGAEGQDLISSGDPVADERGREHFLRAYEEKNSIEQPDKDTAILHVGDKDYSFPIPLVRQDKLWYFDTPAGKEEILNRRIGKNELSTIEVLHAYTEAQREYAAEDRNGDCIQEFAQKFISTEGQRDGLYWPAAEGDEESPFGPFIARAAVEGYSEIMDDDEPEPFHGYLFKILVAQGEHAPGGAFNFVVNGHMILGYGLVAYPAKYGVSGIMTFIVNQEGTIYQKDLADRTPEAAEMTTFDPDDSWTQCKEETSE